MKPHRPLVTCVGMTLLSTTLVACSPSAPPAPTSTTSAPSAAPANPPVSAAVTAAPQPAASAETWELPGNLSPLTTRAELDARFGKANVRDDTLPGAEGEGEVPALTVFPNDAKRRLRLVLDPEQPNNQDAPIQELRVSDPDSRWHDRNGLHPGMSLAELVKRNGAPISFYGLNWDYGGSVQDWHGGKLANGVGDALFHRVTLAARSGVNADALPTGDGSFRSDDPRWPTLGKDMVVAELGISWPHDSE